MNVPDFNRSENFPRPSILGSRTYIVDKLINKDYIPMAYLQFMTFQVQQRNLNPIIGAAIVSLTYF